MRILMVCSTFAPAFVYGGPPRINYHLADALIRQGHEVAVLTTDANGAGRLDVKTGSLTQLGRVPVIYLRCTRPYSYFFAPLLAPHLLKLRGRIDVALVRGHWTFINVCGSAILKHMRVPFILNPEGTLSPWAINWKHAKKAVYWRMLEKRNYNWASGVIALSPTEMAELRQWGCRTDIEIIPNGVAPETLRAFDSTTLRLPCALKDKRNILSLSRIHPKKGLDLLIEAFAYIHAERPPYMLVIAGPAEDPAYRSRLRSQVYELGLTDSVVFLDMVTGDERLALLQSADVFVLPSHSDMLPIAVLEAAACRLPTVITAQCNLPELALAKAGVVVQPDAAAVAQGILQVLSDEDERRAMGERAYHLVCEHFTWDRIAQRVAAYCQRLMHERA
jgi:glycosyltransferase involved in cell wall biosynthesis